MLDHINNFFNNFRLTKTNIFILVVALILTIIIVAIVAIATTPASQPPLPQTVTPTVSDITPEDSSPPPPVKYDEDGQNTIIDKVINRSSLSEKDIAAKKKILDLLPSEKTSGFVYRSATIEIYYTSGVDIFQAEILSTDLTSAKKEGNDWFLSQGASQQGICDFPVQFYLNPEVAESLRNKNITFNPAADGCE